MDILVAKGLMFMILRYQRFQITGIESRQLTLIFYNARYDPKRTTDVLSIQDRFLPVDHFLIPHYLWHRYIN